MNSSTIKLGTTIDIHGSTFALVPTVNDEMLIYSVTEQGNVKMLLGSVPVASSVIGGTLGALTIIAGGITNAMLRNSAAGSVIGRADSTTPGVPADIVASADGQILGRIAGALTFLSPAVFNAGTYGTVSGTNTYVLTLVPPLTSYQTGMVITVLFTNANTGPSTLNINGLGAIDIRKNGVALVANDIAANSFVTLLFDGTYFNIIGSQSFDNQTTKVFGKTSHGFVIGDVLYHNGTDFAKAKANGTASGATDDLLSEARGVVTSVIDVNNFALTSHGFATITGLTANSIYYLSAGTAGLLTTTAPATTGNIIKPILITNETGKAVINISAFGKRA
jgi:hypothetical protein